MTPPSRPRWSHEGFAHQPRPGLDGLPGHFFAPTVLTDVPPEATILREEIFGPGAPVVTWSTEDELLKLANGSEYGLAAYVFAGDLGRALRLGEALEAGMVGINRYLSVDWSG